MKPEPPSRNGRVMAIICGYPIVLMLLALAVNLFLLGVAPAIPALPSADTLIALAVAALLLLINHAWLMTSTELTRLRHRIATTPEELNESRVLLRDAAKTGAADLERRLNAHRNTTENTVYFVLLAPLFALVSPSGSAVLIWIVGYAVARLGYTAAYLTHRTGLRGLFMSLSLIALFGMASYLIAALLV